MINEGDGMKRFDLFFVIFAAVNQLIVSDEVRQEALYVFC